MKFKSLLAIFQYDIFNHQFFLRIGRKNKNSTVFSMVISHIMLITMILYFLFSSFNTFLHTNPQINIQDFDVNVRPFIHLNTENFHFAFRLEDNDGNPMLIDNISNYFTINVSFIVQTQNSNVENDRWENSDQKSYSFERCLREEFPDFEEYYDTNLDHAYCLKNHEIYLGGFWDENKLGYLYITMDMCDSNDSQCVGPDVFKSTFAGSYLTFYIETQNVDGNDYLNPLKKSLKYYSYLLDTDIKKDVNFYIKEVQLKTNDALFYSDGPTIQKFFKQNSIDLDFNANFNIANADNAFWEIYIYSSNQIQIIERTYITLISVFATVGGISKFLLMIGTFITLYYNEMRLQSELLNELFVFDLEGNTLKNQKRVSYLKNNNRKLRRTFSSYFNKEKLNEKFSASVGGSPLNQINLFNFRRGRNNINKNENNNKADDPVIINQHVRIESNDDNCNDFPPILIRDEREKKNPLVDLDRPEVEIAASKQVSLKNIAYEKKLINFSNEDIEEKENNEEKSERIHKLSFNLEIPHSITRNMTFPHFHKEPNSTKRLLTAKTISTNDRDKIKHVFIQDNDGRLLEQVINLNKENEEEKEEKEKSPDFNKESENNDNLPKKDKLYFDIVNENPEEVITEKNLLEFQLNQSLKKLNDAKLSKKTKLKFSSWEIIRATFFPFFLSKNLKKKLKLYKKASGGLLKYINILQMVQMLQQLEKLKLIIFNKNQLALFNYLSKPMISLDVPPPLRPMNDSDESYSDHSGTKVSRIMKYMEGGNIKEQCKDIIKYYNYLLETQEYSDIDIKLFELLDDDLRAILDNYGSQHRDSHDLFRQKLKNFKNT